MWNHSSNLVTLDNSKYLEQHSMCVTMDHLQDAVNDRDQKGIWNVKIHKELYITTIH